MKLARARWAAEQLLTQRHRTLLGDTFVRTVPHRLQRSTELLFDFPITHFIRGSRVLLIRIPRTGSVSTSVHIYGRVENIPHRSAEFYLRSDPEFFHAAVKVAVVRNPWDRLVSAYEFLHSNGASRAKPNPQTRRAMRGLKSIEHLVFDYLEPNAHRLDCLDPTLHHQHSYVCDSSGRIIVDKIFHTEDFGPIRAFMAEYGFGNDMPHLNASAETPGLARTLSPRVREAIGRIYERDVVLFGYENDLRLSA